MNGNANFGQPGRDALHRDKHLLCRKDGVWSETGVKTDNVNQIPVCVSLAPELSEDRTPAWPYYGDSN